MNEKELLHDVLLLLDQGKSFEAKCAVQKALQDFPDNIAFLEALGRIELNLFNFVESAKLFNRVIESDNRSQEAYVFLGECYLGMNMIDQAESVFEAALTLRADHKQALIGLVQVMIKKGEHETAIAMLRNLTTTYRDDPSIHAMLANQLASVNKAPEAEMHFRESLRLRPNNPVTINDFANLLTAHGQADAALELFEQALTTLPNDPVILFNIGNAYKVKKEFTKAIEYYERAMSRNLRIPAVYNNLGIAHKEMGELELAEEAYRQALLLNPDFHPTIANLGYIHTRRNDVKEAERCFRSTIELAPDYAEAHWLLSHILLLTGRFEEGWREYEWRWKVDNFPSPIRNFTQPQWKGESLKGKTILIHCEQGFGDSFNFVRYVPLVHQLGANVLLECPKKLFSLFTSVQGVASLFCIGDNLPDFDYHSPLLSLPLVFKTELRTIPMNIPYLEANPKTVERWRARITTAKGRENIGIVWRASHVDPGRWCPLEKLLSVVENENYNFYSLQLRENNEELYQSSRVYPIKDLSAYIADFSDTAAIIALMDRVISVDTGILHLAGAMGKDTIALLQFSPDWRWMLDISTSVWYSTVRLLRQARTGSWDNVIGELTTLLS
jgi:tetratricopeptide (TPR) repeat protein